MQRRIIPRSEWGAQERDGYGDASIPWAENYLHHSVTIAPDLVFNDANFDGIDDDEKAAMLTLEQIGESNFNAGISYTRLIFPSGRIYQGHSNNRAGAHTIGKNFVARAICFVGNYDVNEPTQAMLESAAWVLQQDKVAGRSNGRLTGGHRDVFATACPGKNAYKHINYINQLAAGPAIPGEVEEMAGELSKLGLEQLFETKVNAPNPLYEVGKEAGDPRYKPTETLKFREWLSFGLFYGLESMRTGQKNAKDIEVVKGELKVVKDSLAEIKNLLADLRKQA